MSDYINKNALIELFKDLADEHETNAISYVALCEVILQQKSIDETEIIRKAFERVVERLEQQKNQYNRRSLEFERKGYGQESEKQYSKACSYSHAIEIVKEEGGIEC